MPKLDFELGVVGYDRVLRSLGGVEQRLKRINALHAKARSEGRIAGPPVNTRRINKMRQEAISAANAEHRQRLRNIRMEEAERRRSIQRAARAQMAADRAAARSRVGFAKRVFGTGRRVVGGAARFALQGATMVGGFAAYDAVQQQMGLEAQAIGLASQASGKGQSRYDILRSAKELERFSKAAGRRSIKRPEDIMSGMRKIHAMTGDIGVAKDSANFLTSFSQGLDTRSDDAAQMFGRLYMVAYKRNSSFKNEELRRKASFEQAKEISLKLGGQGMEGSVEISSYATLVSRLTQIAAGMKRGSFAEDMAELGAFVQMSASDISNPERLMTSLNSFNAWMKSKATGDPGEDQTINIGGKRVGKNKFEGGTDIVIMDKHGARSPVAVIMDMLEAANGDPTKLRTGNIRAQRIIDPSTAPFRKAFFSSMEALADEVKSKGIAKGKLRSELDRFRNAELGIPHLEEMAAANRMGGRNRLEFFKWEVADSIQDSLYRAFTVADPNDPTGTKRDLDPKLMEAINKLIAALPKLIEMLGHMVDKVLEDPEQAAAMAVGGLVAKEAAASAGSSMLEWAAGLFGGGKVASGAASIVGTGAALGTVAGAGALVGGGLAGSDLIGGPEGAGIGAAATYLGGMISGVAPLAAAGYGIYKAGDAAFGDDEETGLAGIGAGIMEAGTSALSKSANEHSGAAKQHSIAAAQLLAAARAHLAATAMNMDPTR